jgi:hypothetical protein
MTSFFVVLVSTSGWKRSKLNWLYLTMTGFELFTCWKRCLKISRTSSTVITISWLQWLDRVTMVFVHCSLLEGVPIGEPYSQSGCCHWCCLCIVPFLKASLLENLIRSPGVAIRGVSLLQLRITDCFGGAVTSYFFFLSFFFFGRVHLWCLSLLWTLC